MKPAERDEKKRSEIIPDFLQLSTMITATNLDDWERSIELRPEMGVDKLENLFRDLRFRPELRERFDEVLEKLEREEKRVQALENQDIAEKLVYLEDELKEIWEYIREDRRMQSSRWRELESQLNALSEQRVVYAAESDPKTFRDELRTGMMEIEGITLVLAKKDPECFHVTVFYDEQTPDYGQLERTVFDTFHEILDRFPDIPADILALLYDASRPLPPHSQIILDSRPEVFSN